MGQRIASEGVLRELQKHPEAWTRVDRILELSQSQQAKFIALQVQHATAAPGLLLSCARCGLRSARAYVSALALAGSCLYGVHAACSRMIWHFQVPVCLAGYYEK